MKRWFQYGLAVAIALLFLAPSHALAYSYGDANTEDVAETFKLVEASISGASPDWKKAEEAYKVRRTEIKSHFGTAVADTLDNNFQEKDAKLTIANFKAVLVMNLDRRFKYAIEDLNDYAAAKLLLAKAKATYDTLSPYMNSGSGDINQAFEDALTALGNPGLFGVGKKEVQPEVFKVKVNFIYAKVKPSFPYKVYVKLPEPSEEKEPVKETTPSKEGPGTTVQPVNNSEEPKETGKAVASEAPEPSASETAAASESASAAPSEEPEANEAAATVEAAPSETSLAAAGDPATAEASPDSISEEAGAEHAPMDRSDKTNPWVSVMAIGGVVLIGGGAVWFARRKGIL
ncbi:hypothetical protein [Cohnella sp.]|uniref:hypothetical protein n=1 Tax=Cohnella sp. TaxID=1883426 RepID=UPI003563BA65